MMKKQKTQTKYGSVGGQALMEGIMMNGPEGKAMALRMPDGSISVEKKTFNSIKDKNKFLGNIRECDAIIHVIRCFDDDNIVREGGAKVDPLEDKSVIDTELQPRYKKRNASAQYGRISVFVNLPHNN